MVEVGGQWLVDAWTSTPAPLPEGRASAVLAGDRASYTITVTNTGPSLARDVVLTTALPAELTDAFAGASGGTIALAPMTIPPTCTVGELAAGTMVTLQFSGHVAPGTPAGSSLWAVATVSASGTDPVAANNTDTDVILVAAQLSPPTGVPPATPAGPPLGGSLPPPGLRSSV